MDCSGPSRSVSGVHKNTWTERLPDMNMTTKNRFTDITERVTVTYRVKLRWKTLETDETVFIGHMTDTMTIYSPMNSDMPLNVKLRKPGRLGHDTEEGCNISIYMHSESGSQEEQTAKEQDVKRIHHELFVNTLFRPRLRASQGLDILLWAWEIMFGLESSEIIGPGSRPFDAVGWLDKYRTRYAWIPN